MSGIFVRLVRFFSNHSALMQMPYVNTRPHRSYRIGLLRDERIMLIVFENYASVNAVHSRHVKSMISSGGLITNIPKTFARNLAAVLFERKMFFVIFRNTLMLKFMHMNQRSQKTWNAKSLMQTK